jgi:SAM-dependent methyltransferase
MPRHFLSRGWMLALCVCALVSSPAAAQTIPEQYKPQVGQAGKDAVWVPTAPVLVEKMLDMAKVTPADFVMDLGSGDGRNVIAAAKRGARGLGVEYNPDLVAFSQRTAASEGVADKAKFVQGDMYAADISQATVLALFLLPQNLDKLLPKFLALKPGTRIVANTFGITGWTPDETEQIEGDCMNWCTSLLWIVPAKVDGTWRTPKGELILKQQFQMVSGELTVGRRVWPIENGRLRGDEFTFTANGTRYTGRVNGDTIQGKMATGDASTDWSATRK